MRTGRLALLVAVLGVAAFFAWRSTRTKPVPVVVGEVDRGTVTKTIANTRSGTVVACRRARLAPAAGGQIASLPVKEGDRVQEGQVLLEVWNEDSAAQMRVASEQSHTAALRAEEACVQASVAEREAERARKLHADGVLPADQLDRAVSAAKSARASCNAASSDVQRSRATAQVATATLKRTVLRAPFAGVIAKVTGQMGEFTTPSPPGIPTPPAIDLIDDRCMYVTAPIDEVDVARVRVGQPAVITIEALPGRRFPARVRRVAPYVVDLEKQARTVDVEVEFVNPADIRELLVGYSADAEIELDRHANVVRVPTPAILEGGRVLVLDDGRLREQKIEAGLANWEQTEVRSGLTPGQKVVVSIERAGVEAGAKAVAETPRRR
jgi:HlyD family secretion protein